MKTVRLLPEIDLLGWSQRGLAERVGLTEVTICRYRTGKRPASRLLLEYLKLAALLHEKGFRVP